MQFPKSGAGRTWLGLLLLFSLAIFACSTFVAPLASAQTQAQASTCVVSLQPTLTNVAWQNNGQTAALALQWSGASAATAPAQTFTCALSMTDQAATRYRVSDLYPGVRLTTVPAGNMIGYELYFDRGASSAVSFDLAGANSLAQDEFGNTLASTPAGVARITMPFAYQMNGNTRKHQGGSFTLSGTQVSFVAGNYDASKPLVVNFWVALPQMPVPGIIGSAKRAATPKIAVPLPNPYLFAIWGFTGGPTLGLDTISRQDGSLISTVPLSEAGETISNGTGLASNPIDGKLYAVLITNAAAGRELVTIDPNTGIVTRIGDLGDAFMSITFAADGTLYGMTGYAGAVEGTLFQIDPATATASQLPAIMQTSGGGNSLAVNFDDGLLYETDGNCDPTFRIFNRTTWASNDVDMNSCTGYMVGLAYFPVQKVFLGSDTSGGCCNYSPGNLYHIDTSGFVSLLGGPMSNFTRGLAFPASDLSVNVIGLPDPVGSGNNVTFTVTVLNNGIDTTTNATVALTPDVNSTIVSATATQGSCTLTSCTLGSIPGNGSVTITVVQTAHATAPGTSSLEAVASGDQPDAYLPDNDASYPVDVRGATTTTIGAAPNPSNYGATVTFTGTVNPSAATGMITFLEGGNVLNSCTIAAGTCTATDDMLSVGTHNIVARYDGDGTYGGGTSAPVAQVVNQTTSTTALSLTNTTIYSGQAAQMTATITTATGGGEPTGTVTFYNSGIAVGTANVIGGAATLSVDQTTFPPGSYNLTATYNGDANVASSTSTPATVLTVNKATTSMAVTSSGTPTTYGQTVSFYATVSIVSGGGTPTGTVQFDDGGINIGGPIPLTLLGTVYQVKLDYAALTAGGHTINATYSGDGNFASSTNSIGHVVNQNGTTNTLTSSANPSVFGQSVTFTATLVPTSALAAGVTGPTGDVNFFDGITNIGTGTIGSPAPGSYVATFTTTALNVATHNITANYVGDTNFTAGPASNMVPQVVNLGQTTTTITSNVGPADLGQPVTFTITVAPVAPAAGTPTGTVQILDGVTNIGSCALASGTCTFQTSALLVGSHTINAQYPGDINFASSNGSMTEVIRSATVTLATPSATTVVYGQSITFDVSVTSTGGTPTGYVTLYDGGTVLGSATLSSGTAQITVSNLPVGTDTVFITYSGDANFSPSTSPNMTITVNPADFTVSYSGPQTVNAGQTATYTVTVTPNPAPYNFDVTLACGTLPAGVTCNFNPNPVHPGNNPATSTLTLTTTAPTIASAEPLNNGGSGTQLAMLLSTGTFGLLGIVAIPDRRKRRAGLLLLTLVLLMAIGLGCGGTSTHVTPHPTGGTPSGTYQVNVTVTGNGGVQHTLQVTLVVN